MIQYIYIETNILYMLGGLSMNRDNIVCGNYSYGLFSLDYFLDSMNRLNQTNIEFWGAGPHLYQDECSVSDVDAIVKKIRSHHLNVICYTPEQCMYPVNIASREKGIRDWSVNYLKRSLEIASQMEAPRTLITIGQGYRNESRDEAWARCRDSLLQLAEYAGKMGTTIMLEHLTKTTTNLCVTAREYLEAMGKDIQHVHFIDGMPGGHLALGDGILPLDQYVRDLEDFGYDQYLTLEILSDKYHENPEPAYAQSIGWFTARGFI